MRDEVDSTSSINSESSKVGGMSPGVLVNDKYQVVSLIGSGGMGTVYRVHQVFLGKEFAFKVLDLHNRSDVSVRRFQQEARTASQLQHPNLVEVHDFGMIADEQPYLVMDLVEGETLAQLVKTRVTLPVDYVVALAIQVGFGLLYAHDKGVVHRDIKPANILLLHPDSIPSEGTVKIVDFGIAKLTQSEDGQIQSLTQTGEIFGSPLYMSPEQCRGTAVDRRSDIYSLGCVMFECLTGSPPFFGETAMATMLKRLSEAPVSLKEGSLGAEFPAQLESIVHKMLKVEPNERYQDFKDVIKDLVALQQSITNSGLPAVEQVKELFAAKPEMNARGSSFAQQTLILALVAIASIIVTTAYDRFILFPAWESARHPPQIKPFSPGIESGAPDSMGAKPARSREQVALDNKKINESLKDRPRVELVKLPSGKDVQKVYFPTQTGKIAINDGPRLHAFLEIEIPPNAEIDLRLNHVSSVEEGVLDGLTSLNITTLGYHNDKTVTNRQVSAVSKFKNLKAVNFDGTGVTSLSSVYNLANLSVLEISGSYVPPSEILKVKRLSKLNTLSFGPVDDPSIIFNELAKSNNLFELRYTGARFTEKGAGKGLSEKEVAALSKLTNLVNLTIDACPSFNDASLKRLLPLKKLKQLRLRDCGLTANAWDELNKFKGLKLLEVTMVGWTPEQRQKMTKLPFQVMQAVPRAERQKEKANKTKSYDKLFDI